MNQSTNNDVNEPRKTGRWHTIYSIFSTVIEMAAIAAVLLWILPLFNIILPEWTVVAILAGFLVFSYISYRIGHPTVLRRQTGSAEEMLGMTGIVDKDMDIEGFVKVRGELWKADSLSGKLVKGEEVTITAIDGLKLSVKRRES